MKVRYQRWEFIKEWSKILKLPFFLGRDLVFFLFILVKILFLAFYLGQDFVFLLFILVKILFSLLFLGRQRVFFLFFSDLPFFLVESVFSFRFFLKSFFYKFPPQLARCIMYESLLGHFLESKLRTIMQSYTCIL